MSDSNASLKRKISSAADLLSVVRTMKAMAASNITQYERAVGALEDYYQTVRLGLVACYRQVNYSPGLHKSLFVSHNTQVKNGVLVFGSDQGLVGQFNDSLTEFVVADLAQYGDPKQAGALTIWGVGERLQSQLAQTDFTLETGFVLPKTIQSITPLVSDILLTMETYRAKGLINEVTLFHNQPNNLQGQEHNHSRAMYVPIKQRLLPLDEQWQRDLMDISWPTSSLPEVVNAAAECSKKQNDRDTQLALIHEYLFVSIYRACAESLASENASRLAAMQRAEKNIDELLVHMNSQFHHLRQSGIDAELFDVISGFKALHA